jgi:hypothetical protein
MTTEYNARVARLIYEREMTARAAKTVVDAAMYGIGCIEGEVRKRIEDEKARANG